MRPTRLLIAGAILLLAWPALSQTPGARDSGLAPTNPAGTQDKAGSGEPVSNANTDDRGGKTGPGMAGGPRGTNLDPGATIVDQRRLPARTEPVLPQTTGSANGPMQAPRGDAPAPADSSRPQ